MSDHSNKDDLAPTLDLDAVATLDVPDSSDTRDDLNRPGKDKSANEAGHWPLKLTGVLVFILALVIIYLWQQQGTIKTQLKQNVSVTLEADMRSLQRQYTQQLANTQAQLSQYRKQQQLLAGTLEATQGQLQRQSDENLDLLKAQSLLNLANDRYVLMRDIDTGILAMQQAIKQLDDLQLPAVEAIKAQILKELNILQSVKTVDMSAYLRSLSEMIGAVDDLSLMSTSRTNSALEPEPEEALSTWAAKWQQWQEALKPMLIIRRHAQTAQAVLTAEEDRLIRLVLKSRYEYVRQALLREDGRMLPIAVSSVRTWLERYFDMQQTSLQPVIKVLADLESTSFDVEYPPIGDALKQLTRYITHSSVPDPVESMEEEGRVKP